VQPGTSPLLHHRYGVAGAYFQAMGIPLLAGRLLGTGDQDGRRVCVVDEAFARFYWAPGAAIGQRVFEGPDARPDDQAFTVVGVVGTVRQTELTDAGDNGTIYFPYRHLANPSLFLETLAPGLRGLVRGIDAELALDPVASMDSRIAGTLVARRSPALLAGLFSLCALLLAAVGSFGVLSYAVSQRRREVGMRMALGAMPRQIAGHFLGMGLRLFAIGSMLGVVGAWLAGKAMQGVLFGVPGLHLASLAATAAVLGTATLLACLLPALRAARVSPMSVLGGD